MSAATACDEANDAQSIDDHRRHRPIADRRPRRIQRRLPGGQRPQRGRPALVRVATTGSAAKAGLVGLAIDLPGLIVGIFGGVLVDQFGYRLVSAGSDLDCATATGAIPLLYAPWDWSSGSCWSSSSSAAARCPGADRTASDDPGAGRPGAGPAGPGKCPFESLQSLCNADWDPDCRRSRGRARRAQRALARCRRFGDLGRGRPARGPRDRVRPTRVHLWRLPGRCRHRAPVHPPRPIVVADGDFPGDPNGRQRVHRRGRAAGLRARRIRQRDQPGTDAGGGRRGSGGGSGAVRNDRRPRFAPARVVRLLPDRADSSSGFSLCRHRSR